MTNGMTNGRGSGAPIVIRRRTFGTIGSIMAAAGVIAGIVGLIWAGELTNYVAVAFLLAGVGLVLWAAMTPQEFSGFFTGRSVRFGTVAMFSTLLLIGIVSLVYLQLARAAITLDATEATLYTLSPETERVLSRVNRPIKIIGFYSSRSLTTRELDDQFFRLYETATRGLITRQYIDPDQQPALARRYGVQYDGQVFIAYADADGSVDLTTLARVPTENQQERDMTQAIARLLIAGQITVYFDVGLGERNSQDSTQEGISAIVAGVQESGIVAKTLDLADIASSGGDIPIDAGAVIFARPVRDLTAAEVSTIQRYLDRGGSLFLMADVLFNDDPFMKESGAFDQYLWNNYGIEALDAAVVDPGASAQTPLDIISANVFAESDIAARLDPASTPTLFSVARAVDVKLQDTPPYIATGRVIFTTNQAYGERDLKTLGETNTYHYDEGVDIPGPLSTVVYSTHLRTGAKIVLVGDGDFISNGRMLTSSGDVSIPGNGILFTDSLVWLTSMNEKIDFAPQMFFAGVPLIFVSLQQLNLITFATIISVPVIVLAVGIGIWVRRSRR